MVQNKLNKTNYKASFLVPDFVEIQRRSFSQFLEKGIAEELSKINPIRSDILKATLTFYPEKYVLILPDYTITEAVLQGKTYSCKLYLPAILSTADSVLPADQRRPGLARPGMAKQVQNKSSKKRLGEEKLAVSSNWGVTFKEIKASPSVLENAEQGYNASSHALLHGGSRAFLKNRTLGEEVLLSSQAKLSLARSGINQLPQQGSRCDSQPTRWPGVAIETPTIPSLQKPRYISKKITAPFGSSTSLATIDDQRSDLRDPSLLSWVFIGSVPLMTKRGHFVVNGSPRVVVNQLVRSPGVYFHERRWGNGKKKRRVVYADFVSRRGAWLRIQADKEGNTWARLKKTPKIPFPLFYDAMAACERRATSWTTADKEALLALHEEINPTQKDSSAENGSQFLVQRFKNPRIYDLGSLGRKRLNSKFGISIPNHQLTSQDLYSAFQQLQELQNNQILPDDIDHLKNRRVRASGELVQGQFEVGIYRLEKAVLGKMRKPTIDLTPRTLLTPKPLNGAFREFFGSSPLSQYMDQTNPLAEITQKRRISSLGPGGINRETAGMAIRGIHPTHYGRICPIETPEGKNAGLVNSLTVYTRVGANGILETPYYSVAHGQLQRRDGFRYFSAAEEEGKGSRVASGDVNSSMSLLLPATPFPIREMGDPQEDFKHMERAKVSYIAISPVQMISVATSLIPFLEHDDANRALMGSNMQRQAVPLLRPERPIVGTGLEALVIAESGHAIQAKASGYVYFVSALRISICTPSMAGGSYRTPKVSSWSPSKKRLLTRPFSLRKVSKYQVSPNCNATIWSKESILSPTKAYIFHQRLEGINYPRHLDRSGFHDLEWLNTRRPSSQTIVRNFSFAPSMAFAQHALSTGGPRTPSLIQEIEALKWQVFTALRGRYRHRRSQAEYVSWVSTRVLAKRVTLRGRADDSFYYPLEDNLIRVGFDMLGRLWQSREKLYSQWQEAFATVEGDFTAPPLMAEGSMANPAHRGVGPRTPSLQGDALQAGMKSFLMKAGKLVGDNAFYFNREAEAPLSCFKSSKKTNGDESQKRSRRTTVVDKHHVNRKSVGWSSSRRPAVRRPPPALTAEAFESKAIAGQRGGEKAQVARPLVGPWVTSNVSKQLLKMPFGSSSCGMQSLHASHCNYPLQSYHRSNQETCLTQMPAVCEGDWVQRGDLLADCSASQFGELALGKNILIAYLPWEGYNFEDAVVISERLVSDDVYTSIHIQKYEIEIRETRFGFEKITNQVPGVADSQKSHLNNQGIATVGSWVREGDIIVGKVSPRSSHPLSPYERLAYDIANVEAATTEDTSLRVPKGVEGRVINCQVFKAANIPLEQQTSGPGRVRVYLAEKRKIQVGDKVAGRHGNKGIVSRILPRQDMPYLPNGGAIDMILNPLGIPSRMNVGQVFECLLGLAGIQLGQQFKVTPFDEIYGAEASRSLVYLKLYQARLRTHQDWLFNLSFPGKSVLFDGRTGSPFDQWVTVGKAYMLKLVHLVDEKIHARSTGPYSLVTKQPLGGRSKHGGQRLGEMEVWALEGFGAAYTLQEMLTSKSDDIVGREQVVEAILFKGRMSLGNPEAFKVLVRELQSLCLDVGVYAISPDRLQREVVDIGCIP
jgi:DNA-directed RNA polymerase beta subunit